MIIKSQEAGRWRRIESCCSVTKSCSTLHDSLDSSMPGFPVPHQLPEFTQVHVHWISDTIQPSHSLSPSSLSASIFPSIRVSSNESAICTTWPKHWSFSFGIGPSKEYSGLISFKIDWFHLLAVREILNVFSNPIVWRHRFLRHSAFFIIQLSDLYMTTRKIIALTIWTFVGKVMFLLFNISAVLVCHSFSSKEQTSFNFMVSVTIFSDFGAQEKKTCHCFYFSAFLFVMKWRDQMPY